MRLVLALLLLACTACTSTQEAPYLVVLGTAQDGGYPQIGCEQDCCRAAHETPSLRRFVACGMIVDPLSGERWLLEATPDLPEQIELARDHSAPNSREGRPPLADGIFITHAHMGHYTGLLHLGREAYATETTPVLVTEIMGYFLKANGPWSLLFEAGHLEHVQIEPGEAIRLNERLSVTPFLVPHRPEFSDTVGFLVEGPNGSALFLPDIDKWERWDERIEDWIERVDVALLDGTFFDGDELPGRDMARIPHPFIVESLERFAPLPLPERDKIRFFHLNHSNPAISASSDARRRIEAAGMHVASDGEKHTL